MSIYLLNCVGNPTSRAVFFFFYLEILKITKCISPVTCVGTCIFPHCTCAHVNIFSLYVRVGVYICIFSLYTCLYFFLRTWPCVFCLHVSVCVFSPCMYMHISPHNCVYFSLYVHMCIVTCVSPNTCVIVSTVRVHFLPICILYIFSQCTP